MKNTAMAVSLWAMLGAPAGAIEINTTQVLERLSDRALARGGLKPEWLGPVGCGYGAMIDTVALPAVGAYRGW